MSQIAGIPVPSGDQIIVAIELLFILLPFKMLQGWLISETRKNRNRIIHMHVKSGHNSRFKHCTEGHCSTIQKLGNPQFEVLALQPEIESDLELPQ